MRRAFLSAMADCSARSASVSPSSAVKASRSIASTSRTPSRWSPTRIGTAMRECASAFSTADRARARAPASHPSASASKPSTWTETTRFSRKARPAHFRPERGCGDVPTVCCVMAPSPSAAATDRLVPSASHTHATQPSAAGNARVVSSTTEVRTSGAWRRKLRSCVARVTASRTRVRFSSVPTSSDSRRARAARSANERIVRASASEKAFGRPDCRSKTPTTRSSRIKGTTSSERASGQPAT